jgi:L-lysine exporter family protein LysE/ArgO
MLQTIISGFVLGFIASPSCPSNAEEIRLGTRYHAGYALLVGIGAVTGDAIILLAVLFGLAPLLNTYPWLNSNLLFIGSAILFYVSWGIFKEAMNLSGWTSNANQATATLLRAFWIGFAITTFNPFTALWWVALLTPILDSSQNIICFSLMVLLGSLAWFLLLAAILQFSKSWLTPKFRQWVLVGSGLLTLGYAVYFLLQASKVLF